MQYCVEPQIRKISLDHVDFSFLATSDEVAALVGVSLQAPLFNELSDKQLSLALALRPLHCLRRRNGYLAIANCDAAMMAKQRHPKLKLSAFVWPSGSVESPARFAMQLALFSSTFLSPHHKFGPRAIVKLFTELSYQERTEISPLLKTRLGLEHLTGISRRKKLEAPELLRSPLEDVSVTLDEARS